MTFAGFRSTRAIGAQWDSAHRRTDAGSLLGIPVGDAAATPAERVLNGLGSFPGGLDADEARRLALVGPNAVRTHHAQPLRVLGRQLHNVVLILLAVTLRSSRSSWASAPTRSSSGSFCWPASGWGSSTSTGRSGRPRRCTLR